MKLNTMFDERNDQASATSSRSLEGTAQLTNLSTQIANSIMQTVGNDIESYRSLVEQSKTNHDAMDKLITTAYDLAAADSSFISALPDTIVDGMLKSQQSKRSRAKGKIMTMDNYLSMMIGAVAENLLRLVTNRPKSAVGSRQQTGSVSFSEDRLLELADDQEQLRKEIRNVQSKKSIMKSKEGFDVESDRWQSLLQAEQQLKNLRTGTVRTVAIDDTKNALADMMSGVDIQGLKSADAKHLLELAMSLVKEAK